VVESDGRADLNRKLQRRFTARESDRVWTPILQVWERMAGRPADEVYAELIQAMRVLSTPEKLTLPAPELRQIARQIEAGASPPKHRTTDDQ
jgi:hypothetical protein